MATAHTLLELRTSKQAEHTPETASQLFATLPRVRDRIWHQLLGTNERVSFEILVQNQTIYFLAYVPTRLLEYMQSLLQASYPEILVTPLAHDPLVWFFPTPEMQATHDLAINSRYRALGTLKLKNDESFPLKTYQDFHDIDPLAPVLATLAKSQEYDQALIQLVISQDRGGWKKTMPSSPLTLGTLLTQDQSTEHLQKSLINKKMQQRAHRVSIKLVTMSNNHDRSQLLLETLATAFQSISQSEGNSLVLKRPHLGTYWLTRGLHQRTFSGASSAHLSLDELATLFHLPTKKLSHIPNIAWGKQLLGEPPENLPIVTKKTDQGEKKDINPFARALYKNSPTIYGIHRSDRRKHVYAIGKTGTGKSTLLANMAINDIKNNEGICVIDPHGDLVETLLDYIPSHRINDVVYFNPADVEKTVQINLFEGENVIHRELIASGIVSIFQKLYAYSWGPRLEYILRNSLLTLLTTPSSRMSDITELLTNAQFRDKIINELQDDILKSFWLYEFNKMPDRQRMEAIAPILNKVGQFVSSPLIRNVVNAHKSSFSIEQIMNEGKILLVNLSQGRLGEDNATLLGAMLITKIQLAAMARVDIPEAERRDFYLYVDEFQNFATQSFNKILSEARKYRLNLTLANQYIAQIPEDVQKAIFGNCGSIISFIMGADDARVFAKEYGGHYTEEDLVSLGRYQIINKLSIENITSQPFPAQTLSLASATNTNRDKVIAVSRERYAKKRQ